MYAECEARHAHQCSEQRVHRSHTYSGQNIQNDKLLKSLAIECNVCNRTTEDTIADTMLDQQRRRVAVHLFLVILALVLGTMCTWVVDQNIHSIPNINSPWLDTTSLPSVPSLAIWPRRAVGEEASCRVSVPRSPTAPWSEVSISELRHTGLGASQYDSCPPRRGTHRLRLLHVALSPNNDIAPLDEGAHGEATNDSAGPMRGVTQSIAAPRLSRRPGAAIEMIRSTIGDGIMHQKSRGEFQSPLVIEKTKTDLATELILCSRRGNIHCRQQQCDLVCYQPQASGIWLHWITYIYSWCHESQG